MATAGSSSTPPPQVMTGTRSMKMPTFSGGTEKDELSPRDFVERIEAYCKVLKKATNEECGEFQLALRGNATIWWRTLSRRGIDKTIWDDVKKEFLATYAPTITGQTAHAIGQLEQKGTESVNEYFNRLDQIMEEIMATYTQTGTINTATYEATRNHIQRYLFIGGLKETIRVDVLKTPVTSLADALKNASKSELIHKKESPKVFALEDMMDNLDGELDEEEINAINQWRMKRGKKPIKRGPLKCYNCDKMGHIARNCRSPRKKQGVRALDDDYRREEQPDQDEQEEYQPRYSNGNTDINSMDFW